MIKFVKNQSGDADVETIMNWINSYVMYQVEDGIAADISKCNEIQLLQSMKEHLYSINCLYAPQHRLLEAGNSIKSKLKYFVKRLIRKSINWYIADVLEGQTEFNASVVRYENENIQMVQKLMHTMQEMSQRLSIIDAKSSSGLDDDWYLAFEDVFRGDDNVIKERVQKYVNYLKDKNDIFEIGCGRGELLTALKEKGIQAEGVDLNKKMVTLCKQKQLDVAYGDGVEILKEKTDDSLDAVVALQVVEHLALSDLKKLVDEAYRKLKKDGLLIIETVNPLALGVFCYGFYIDPTHTKPIHPAMMRFMLEHAGFNVDPVQFDEYFPDEYRIPVSEDMQDNVKIAFEKINDQMYGAQDYYLIGRK